MGAVHAASGAASVPQLNVTTTVPFVGVVPAYGLAPAVAVAVIVGAVLSMLIAPTGMLTMFPALSLTAAVVAARVALIVVAGGHDATPDEIAPGSAQVKVSVTSWLVHWPNVYGVASAR